MKQAVIDCQVTRLRSKHRLTIYPSNAMERTNKELRSIALQYQVGRTYALVMENIDKTLTQLFTLRVTEVFHHSRTGVPIRLECERCIAYTSIEKASDPLEVEPDIFITMPRQPSYWQGHPKSRGPKTATGISVEEYHLPNVKGTIGPEFNRPNDIDTALFESRKWPYQKLLLYPVYTQTDFYSRQLLYDQWSINIDPINNPRTPTALAVAYILCGIALTDELERFFDIPAQIEQTDQPLAQGLHLADLTLNEDEAMDHESIPN